MIVGIGTDLVEVERIADKMVKRSGFMEQVFSVREIAYCQKQAVPAESFAARFAAKEAFLKALGTGMAATFELYQIEVLNYESGQPYLQLSDKLQQVVAMHGSVFKLHVSLSHTRQMATATVLIEVV